MIARGDMGVEIPLEDVPVIQKMLIQRVYTSGKYVITATQMLDSMMNHPRPTRAEATDVANAIYDGTSVIMLSGETAAGKYPVEAVRTMARIAERTEEDINYRRRFREHEGTVNRDVTNAISHATCSAAYDLEASAIITVTQSGQTARMISKYRPQMPIIGCTTQMPTYRHLSMSWGVVPVLCGEQNTEDGLFKHAMARSKECGVVQDGDLVVITAGVPLGIPGTTNLLKVQTVGDVILHGTGIGEGNIKAGVCVAKSEREALQNFRAGDILVGKVTPKGETELTAEERLLRAIFGEKAREVRDTSLKVPHGAYGIIVDAKVFTRENGDELAPGVNQTVRIYIAQKRKISVGDKMAGRHGNKGVVSRVLPVEDMPFLPNGRPLDIVLNPLGVPSRMNIGQVLEIHLSLAAKALGFNVSTPIFDGANENDIQDTLELANDYVNTPWEEFEAKYKDTLRPEVMDYLGSHLEHRKLWEGVPISRDGKVRLRDGRTGEYFDGAVTIGHMHYLKLHHLVDDKIHARSTGPYSLVTQQPLGGKAQFGGQRFGEMEVWALEAYGASYTLQEIMTVKSDDVVGRVKTYEAIIKGENIPEPGVPESFKVLLKEMQSLGLDVQVQREDGTEVEMTESIDYGDTELRAMLEGDRHYNDRESYSNYGYQEQEFKNNELVNVESDSKETNDDYTDDLYDAYTDDSENE